MDLHAVGDEAVDEVGPDEGGRPGHHCRTKHGGRR
jgi:hypothetical protein